MQSERRPPPKAPPTSPRISYKLGETKPAYDHEGHAERLTTRGFQAESSGREHAEEHPAQKLEEPEENTQKSCHVALENDASVHCRAGTQRIGDKRVSDPGSGVAHPTFFPAIWTPPCVSISPSRKGKCFSAPAVVSRRSVPGRKRASGHNLLVHRGGRRVTREGRNVSGAAALARLDATSAAVAPRADDSKLPRAGQHENMGASKRLRSYIRPLHWRLPSPGHHDSRTPRASTGNGVWCAGRESA